MSAGNNNFDGLHACDSAAYGVIDLLSADSDYGVCTYQRLVEGIYRGSVPRQNGPAGVCVVKDGTGKPLFYVTVVSA